MRGRASLEWRSWQCSCSGSHPSHPRDTTTGRRTAAVTLACYQRPPVDCEARSDGIYSPSSGDMPSSSLIGYPVILVVSLTHQILPSHGEKNSIIFSLHDEDFNGCEVFGSLTLVPGFLVQFSKVITLEI